MSKHFCCCIPVRVAVFFASLITFLASGFVSAVIWFTVYEIQSKKVVNNVDFGDINTKGKVVIIVAGVLSTIVCLTSLFGFIGSVVRNRRMVNAYSTMVWIIYLLECAAVGTFLYFVFSGRTFMKSCTVQDDAGVIQDCKFTLKTWQKVVYTIVAIVALFVQLYIASVIGRYKDQLYQENDYGHDYKLAKASTASTYQPTYYPTTVQDSAHQGLLNPAQGQYPYSDAAHSFGHTAQA